MIIFWFFFCGLSSVLSVTAAPNASEVSDIKLFCIHSYDTAYKQTSIKDISKIFDLKLKFAFYVHGWKSEFSIDDADSSPYKIGLEWVKAEKTNFCGVDWSELASHEYVSASQIYVKTVGTQLASILMALKDLQVKMDSITITGHSLGAHVSGFAGKTIYESTGSKISTIFGLDPAGPFFTMAVDAVRSDYCLSKDDATFVQILHTSMGMYGTARMIGHADFIVNGGKAQSKCWHKFFTFSMWSCSHSHAIEIFYSSFSHPCTAHSCLDESREKEVGFAKILSWFSKKECPALMSVSDVFGIHNHRLNGTFQLDTSISKPYCMSV